MKKLKVNQIYQGDSSRLLADKKLFPSNSVDLIVTSPPYADRRRKTYKGVSPAKYVEWFMPFADQMYRVLGPKGSLILNIKESVNDGERNTYVLELILKMREEGWVWVEDYIWHKKNTFPGLWPNRFRDAWEHCLHFTKDKHFKMYQDAVKVPIGDWAESRMKKLGKNDKIRIDSKTNSGFGRKLTNWEGKRKVYPSNVLYMSTISANKNHSAVFPEALPSWFIKLFSKKGDVVLDPFLGSGTTAVAALRLDRNYLGIELDKKYYKISKTSVAKAKR